MTCLVQPALFAKYAQKTVYSSAPVNSAKRPIIICCNNGKSRSGLVASCYLILLAFLRESGQAAADTALDTVARFCRARLTENSSDDVLVRDCLPSPSQRLWARYYQHSLNEHLPMNFPIRAVSLKAVKISSFLPFSLVKSLESSALIPGDAGYHCFFRVFTLDGKLVHESSRRPLFTSKPDNSALESLALTIPSRISLRGEYQISVFMTSGADAGLDSVAGNLIAHILCFFL